MDVLKGKNKRYRKQLTKFGKAKFYEVNLGCAAMFVVSCLTRCLVTPRVIASFLALKCALEPRLLTEILLFSHLKVVWKLSDDI